MRILAYVPDLMDRSKVAAAASAVTFVATPSALPAAAAEADLVVVDLTRPGVLEMVAGLDGRVIGFANHTQRDLMEAARAAGCTTVLARSAFFSRLSELLAPDER
ncbi:MAG: hypothetical protein M3011_13645 [Actinomycetota bacterium]|nr:hypothetical protein [Actinomycetota bacterium]